MTSPVTPTPVTAGPPVPSIGDPEATFDSQLEAYHTWQKNNLQPEINTIAAQTYTNAVAAGERAAEAASSASAASSSASAASSSASAASNSAAAAAQAVASLPGGTINDTTPSATNTYSSNKINTLLNDKQAKITASGLLKGDGLGGVSAAGAGTDYQAPLVFSGAGQNIKTVGGQSLGGSGDITISSGLTLIASLNVTAVSALDFLNVFSSTYDDYVIEIKGLRPSAADYPIFRVANSGTVDAGANYWAFNGPSGSVSSASNFLYLTHSTQGTDAAGCTGIIRVRNVNSSTQMRSIDTQVFSRDSGASAVRSSMWVAGYVAASTISGFRILWSGGATFQAQGNVRVYGVAK